MPKRQRESINSIDTDESSNNHKKGSNSSTKSIKPSSSTPSSESSDTEHQNDAQSIDAEDSKTRSETLRKRQHQKSDKQRRAKIKEGMDQLKTLVSMHGKLESPDQASIVTASIDLVHSLRNEIVSLKSQIDAAQASNVQQRAALQQFQSRMYNPPFQTPAHQLFNDPPLDLPPIPPPQAPVKRSSSVVSNNSGVGVVSNAQFAQLSAQIQQIRPYNHNNNNNNNNINNNNSQQMQSPQQQSQQLQQYTPMQLQRLASVLGFPNALSSHQGEVNSIMDGSPLPQRSSSMGSQMSHQHQQQHNYNPQNSPQAPRQPWDQ